jgi:hypothetical protein
LKTLEYKHDKNKPRVTSGKLTTQNLVQTKSHIVSLGATQIMAKEKISEWLL